MGMKMRRSNVISKVYSHHHYVKHTGNNARLFKQVCYLHNGVVSYEDLRPYTIAGIQHGRSADGRRFVKRGTYWVQLYKGRPCI